MADPTVLDPQLPPVSTEASVPASVSAARGESDPHRRHGQGKYFGGALATEEILRMWQMVHHRLRTPLQKLYWSKGGHSFRLKPPTRARE